MATQASPILAASSASAEQAIAYITARGTPYSPASIITIVGHYWDFAPPAGIDPALALAQCIHETSDQDPVSRKWLVLASWWSQRPRRNPAGLGVTGRTQATPPTSMQHTWAFDERGGIWRHGLSFPSWELAVRAQLGRLLAYAMRDQDATSAQRALIDEALGWRPFPAELRSTASTLRHLGAKHNPTGQGWASPGDTYGEKIAEIATAIARQ